MKNKDKGISGRPFRRLTVLMLAFCVLLTMMPLSVFAGSTADRGTLGAGRERSSVYILGRAVKDGTVPADQFPHKGKITYDSASATLILENVSLDLDHFSNGSGGNLVAGIYAMSDINIVLLGDNVITSGSNSFASGTEYVSGIDGWDDISIAGDPDASLSISLAEKSGSSSNITNRGIDCGAGLHIDGVMLMVSTGRFGKCTGIYSWGAMTVEKGARVRVDADGSSNTAVSGTNDIGKSEILDGSVLEMSSEGTAFNCWTPGEALKSVSAMVSSKSGGAEAREWDKKTRLYNYKYVKFTGNEPEERGEGGARFGDDVRILGKKVDESNCDDVLGDGKVSFDLETDTLILDNASLDLDKFHHEYDDSPDPDSGCNFVAGIDADRSISIVLKGRNTIYSSTDEYPAGRQYVYGINAGAMTKTDISGPGSLSISFDKNNEAIQYFGISSGDELDVDGAAVTIDLGGPVKGEGMDIGFNDLALADGASLRVKTTGGGSTGVYYTMATGLSMDESSLLEMTADGRAFSCYMLNADVKELGALVNTEATAAGAEVWDKTTQLTAYKYVRFPENYAHIHELNHVDGKAASCKEDGYEEYWECSCGALFADGAGEHQIGRPIVIPASGEHSWDKGKITRIATVFHKGEKTYTCTVCGEKNIVEFTLRDAVKDAAEKVTEWLRKIFGADEPDGQEPAVSSGIQKPEAAGASGVGTHEPEAKGASDSSSTQGSETGATPGGDGSTKSTESGAVCGSDDVQDPENEAVKAVNTVSVRGKTATLRYKKLKKETRVIKGPALMKVSDARGNVTYRLTGVNKAKYKKYFSIDPKTGNVKVKKKLRRGVYKLTVVVTASGDDDHEAAARTVTCRVRVR